MVDTTKNESITEVVPRTLGLYLKKHSTLKQIILDFPEPNLKIKKPSVSISAPSPNFTPKMNPYPAVAPTEDDIKNSKAPVDWVVGEYEFNLQLDLWAKNKEQLDDQYDELFNLLNPNINPMGLELPMKLYFGCICSYLYVGHTRQNSSESSVRDEWRMSLEVLASCTAIRNRKEFIIEDPQIIASEISKEVIIEPDE